MPMKIRKISEKTVYTLLWSTIAAASALLVGLCIFAAAKRSNPDKLVTKGPETTKGTLTTTDPIQTLPDTTPDTGVDGPAVMFMPPVDGTLTKEHSIETLSYSKTMDDYRTHSGVDIEAEVGSAVKASLEGVISGVYTDPLMGKVVEITHEGGYKTLYKNLADELPDGIVEGEYVSTGQLIGAVGESAICELADEGHLHFELVGESGTLDPRDFIDFGD